ncbi:hypothetical protein N7488_005712 [Penicillium malachiteum]|nr:hypothetical protein N7488_005712 [Penicillium malachiteum]
MYPEDEDALLSIPLLYPTAFCAVCSYTIWRYISVHPFGPPINHSVEGGRDKEPGIPLHYSNTFHLKLKPMEQALEHPVSLDMSVLGDRPRVQYFPSYGRENTHLVV